MKRGLVASLSLLAVLFAFFALRQPASADEPASRFVAHEWGVWVVDEGRVAHLPALAAECPDFVLRAPQSARQSREPYGGGRQVPRIRSSPVTVEKPVIFFHTDRPIDNVRVRVRFPRGEPWLVWPDARIRRRSVEWRGRIVPRDGREGLGRTIHNGRPHPWWDLLRQVAGTYFVSDSGSSETFLFYDGTMPFRSAFTFEAQGSGWVPSRSGVESKVWIQDGQRVHAYDVDPGQRGGTPRASPAASIVSLLRTELLSRGLLPGEADSLLQIWREDLVPPASGQRPQPRAIYFVDRASYERMLPLTISPTPDALIRVGLVIEMLR